MSAASAYIIKRNEWEVDNGKDSMEPALILVSRLVLCVMQYTQLLISVCMSLIYSKMNKKKNNSFLDCIMAIAMLKCFFLC